MGYLNYICPFPTILVRWFLRCRCSLLPSLVWPLPICLDSWTDIPGSYAILLFTASDLASINSHIHNWVLFLLWLHPFILSGVISSLISSSILGTYCPGEFLCQYPIILPFHTVHGVLMARILKWFSSVWHLINSTLTPYYSMTMVFNLAMLFFQMIRK